MHAGDCQTDDSKLSRTKRHLQISFKPTETLTKNNLSFERTKVAVSASIEGLVGILVHGAAGGEPGETSGNLCSTAEAVSVENAGAMSDTGSASRIYFASGSEPQKSRSSSSFNSDKEGQRKRGLVIK